MSAAAPWRAKVEHALLLIARMDGGEPDAARAAQAALARWRASGPDYEQAYSAARAGWDATCAAALRGDLPLPGRQDDAVRRNRRNALKLLGLGALALGTGGLARWHWQQPVHQRTLATARGQTLRATLPDGSVLDADARTRARIAFYRDRREIWLDEGEIRFTVAADPQRPFVVLTDWGRVRVLGTVFTVEARHRHMRVQVAEGRVAVWPDALGDRRVQDMLAAPAPTVLEAGQGVVAEAGALGMLRPVAARDIGPWRQGWLVFDDTPLPEAVARWNDYLQVPLQLDGGAALGRLRITGSFPLRAPAAFVDSLPGILPVRVQRGMDGVVRISGRA